MVKRLFWLSAGVSLGVGSSVWVRRRVQRYAPDRLAAGASQKARALGHELTAALDEGRLAMQQRETELWAGLETDRPGDRKGESRPLGLGTDGFADRNGAHDR